MRTLTERERRLVRWTLSYLAIGTLYALYAVGHPILQLPARGPRSIGDQLIEFVTMAVIWPLDVVARLVALIVFGIPGT